MQILNDEITVAKIIYTKYGELQSVANFHRQEDRPFSESSKIKFDTMVWQRKISVAQISNCSRMSYVNSAYPSWPHLKLKVALVEP